MKRTASKLWAYRPSNSRGWHWALERTVDEETSKLDLDVARDREPTVHFQVSKKQPTSEPNPMTKRRPKSRRGKPASGARAKAKRITAQIRKLKTQRKKLYR